MATTSTEGRAADKRRLILDALQKSGGVQARAAKLLGISERSLWYRVKKLRIQVRPSDDEPPPPAIRPDGRGAWATEPPP